MITWKWQCTIVIVVTSNVFGETPYYNLIFSINLHHHFFFGVFCVYHCLLCVKVHHYISQLLQMWCQFMCVHYHLFICQSSLLQLVTQLLFITYFNAPFHCHQGSYLLRAFTFFFIDYLFLFSLWLVSICVFSHLVLLMDGFLSLIFLYTWFFLFVINLMFKRHLIFFCHFFVFKKKSLCFSLLHCLFIVQLTMDDI